MKNLYLIDFENVGSDGLNGVSALSADDKVILFYSTNSNKITMKMHISISTSNATFEYHEIAVGGKNALDYQLSTYLGYLIANKDAEKYYIVTKDIGYQYICKFWENNVGMPIVQCVDAIKSTKVKQTTKALDEIEVILEPYTELPVEDIYSCIAQNNRQEVCLLLKSHLGQEKGNELYNAIKKILWK